MQGACPTLSVHATVVCVQDKWRTVVIDDRIPVDLFGQPLVVGMRPLQLWPLLLSKAVLKLMKAMRTLQLKLPHQVAVFQVRGAACWELLKVQSNKAVLKLMKAMRTLQLKLPHQVAVFQVRGLSV